MHQQPAARPPVVVRLPVEIDVTNADQVYDRLAAAAATGAPLVVADCSATIFCDVAGVRRLIMCHARTAARGVQLRLVIAPGGLLRRLLELLGADCVLPVYPSIEEATMLAVHPARDPLSLSWAADRTALPWAAVTTTGRGGSRPHPPLSVTGTRLSVLVWDSLG